MLNRFKIENRQQGLKYLYHQLEKVIQTSTDPKILFVYDESVESKEIEKYLIVNNIPFQKALYSMISDITEAQANKITYIFPGFFDPKKLSFMGRQLVSHPYLSKVHFDFLIILKEAYSVLNKHDWQDSSSFVSPLLESKIDYFSIYEASLFLFERKCQIRDYMDLCQLLEDVTNRNIEGDIAEFGSLNGHSGYLIASVLQAFNSTKELYMFDLFGEKAEENIGVDFFWNNIWNQLDRTDLLQLKSKFDRFRNVKFIKGDFVKTLNQTPFPNKLSLVYIDCDSYRGTKFLLENLYEKHLSKHGIIILEDYGHGPLLGNRIAFHNFFDERKDCYKFFSQFSGFQIVVKL